jgi:hypothetical protein
VSRMNGVSRECLDKFVQIFIDNNLIYLRQQKNLTNFALGTTLFLEKEVMQETVEMLFCQLRILQLGHGISEEGIMVEPTKVEAIRECLLPTNVPEVSSSMGLVGYCRRFVEGFEDRKSDHEHPK